jgi:hypothetical protein
MIRVFIQVVNVVAETVHEKEGIAQFDTKAEVDNVE